MAEKPDFEKLRLLGVTMGDPFSAATYSGVPSQLFSELDRRKVLVGRLNADQRRCSDLFHGFVDWGRTWEARQPRRNAYWRYLPENIEKLTKRMLPRIESAPEHDAIIQIGVAGIPKRSNRLIAHVEISIEAAAALPVFSESYGFSQLRDKYLARALEGERQFLSQCDLVWTNTSWTAETLSRHGLPSERLWIHPPACNFEDPGPVERDWEPMHVLFVGKDWIRKGGPQLVDAFKMFRQREPMAQLTIIGCDPDVAGDGVTVHGYLDKNNPEERAIIDSAFRRATVFCMPSIWESVGLVYMEAALYGLPVIMIEGQSRIDVFPDSMALHLENAKVASIVDALNHISKSHDRLRAMGQAGRRHVLQNYTWPVVAERLLRKIRAM